MRVKIGFISDLHTFHERWENTMFERGKLTELNHADIIVFCGDMSSQGYSFECESFMKWFDGFMPHAQKVMIAGNHDFFFDTNWKAHTDRGAKRFRVKTPSPDADQKVEELLLKYPRIHYLNDSGVNLYGLNFWGSPVTPWFHDWAFNRTRCDGQENVVNGIKQHWDKIPNDTDILVVHGPPYKKLDLLAPKFRRFNEDINVGCKDLSIAIERVQPRVVSFGHIHEGHGIFSKDEEMKDYYQLLEKREKAIKKLEELKDEPDHVLNSIQHNINQLEIEIQEFESEDDGIIYVNASCLDENYKPNNPPIVIDIEV